MGTQINQNGTDKQGKTKIYLTTDEVVGLLMEWAESYDQPEWVDKMVGDMAEKYASVNDQPTEEEKIDFIRTMTNAIPNGFFVKDVALRFIRNYRGDDDE